MRYSYLTGLECSRCHKEYDPTVAQGLCTCGAPLVARYDLDGLMKKLTPADLVGRDPTLWRYHELLPVSKPDAVVTLGEGMTPLVPATELGRQLGVESLFIKEEGVLPSGSFKTRGATVGISRAKELGIDNLAAR